LENIPYLAKPCHYFLGIVPPMQLLIILIKHEPLTPKESPLNRHEFPCRSIGRARRSANKKRETKRFFDVPGMIVAAVGCFVGIHKNHLKKT